MRTSVDNLLTLYAAQLFISELIVLEKNGCLEAIDEGIRPNKEN